MKRTRSTQPRQTRCDGCGQLTPAYNVVNYGSADQGYKQLCGQCFNAEAARLDDLIDFQDAKFEPILLVDCTGKAHNFYFRTRLFGPGIALDAFELRHGYPAGYRFQIIGDPKDDLLALFARLLERMRRALSIKHIKRGSLGLQIADRVVQGLIEWDDAAEGRVPLIVVDGRAITWEEFGRMLMTFEGWQFKLEIRDKSEEF